MQEGNACRQLNHFVHLKPCNANASSSINLGLISFTNSAVIVTMVTDNYHKPNVFSLFLTWFQLLLDFNSDDTLFQFWQPLTIISFLQCLSLVFDGTYNSWFSSGRVLDDMYILNMSFSSSGPISWMPQYTILLVDLIQHVWRSSISRLMWRFQGRHLFPSCCAPFWAIWILFCNILVQLS